MRLQATAFAPAGVGNLAVGFDALGMALESPGDLVTVRQIPEPEVRIGAIGGIPMDLPARAEDNTAGMALLSLLAEVRPGFGFEVALDKGIPLGSGMGGSAASAVGAVVAANALLPEALSTADLLPFAVRGEAVASGALHADNVAPCLLGGIRLVGDGDRPWVMGVPAPSGVRCVVVRPALRLDTRESRKVLPQAISLHQHVRQAGHLARFVAACAAGDLPAIGECLRDEIVEPARAPLVPGFAAVQRAGFDHGALGCSIAGAGPSVFAWCRSEVAHRVASAMVAAFAAAGIAATAVESRLDAPGARVI